MGLRLVSLFLFAALFGGCTRGGNESYIALYTDCAFELTDTGRRQTTGFQDHFSFGESHRMPRQEVVPVHYCGLRELLDRGVA